MEAYGASALWGEDGLPYEGTYLSVETSPILIVC